MEKERGTAAVLAAFLLALRLLLPGPARRLGEALRAALIGDGAREIVETLGRGVAQGGP